MDEPRRPRGEPAAGLPSCSRTERELAVRRVRATRRGRSTACSSTPRSRTRRAAREMLANFLFDVCGCARTLDDGRLHRRARSRASASRSGERARRSAASPAAWTRRWRPRSCTARSATGSPASSSTTGCCAAASASRWSAPSASTSGCTLRRASTRASASSRALAGVDGPRAEAQDHRPHLHRRLRGREARALGTAPSSSCRARSTRT